MESHKFTEKKKWNNPKFYLHRQILPEIIQAIDNSSLLGPGIRYKRICRSYQLLPHERFQISQLVKLKWRRQRINRRIYWNTRGNGYFERYIQPFLPGEVFLRLSPAREKTRLERQQLPLSLIIYFELEIDIVLIVLKWEYGIDDSSEWDDDVGESLQGRQATPCPSMPHSLFPLLILKYPWSPHPSFQLLAIFQ